MLDILRALSAWIDQQPHIESCKWGTVIQSGPLEGNKCSCTCGLIDLQTALDRFLAGA